MSLGVCQRCNSRENAWTVVEARLKVGEVDWKVALCRRCTDAVQNALLFIMEYNPDDPDSGVE